jgi:hypothetical protein
LINSHLERYEECTRSHDRCSKPDCSPSWHYSNPLTFKGVDVGIGKILHPLFCKYGYIPTYLINNVVLERQEFSGRTFPLCGTNVNLALISILNSLLRKKNANNYAGKKGSANCCFYPKDVEFQKDQAVYHQLVLQSIWI